MEIIKRLPESVRSTVRSGVVLFDLTRVVEELVFNSLDAGARKVSVFVGVGTCYVKVMDDGCGISRDGLVILGERYATSKLHHLADMDAATATFGFRGEALASISDVSLVEVITKAYGRPNGYRKVMKGSKCMYLGIDDDREDVGTTVIVRDLFYNQPVRRKYMQSSSKKVLHSVKKCILRVALVHREVSYRVVDIESEGELLHINSSSSPLSLLRSGFGIEDCNFLHELNANDGVLSITGYVSSPCESFTIKAIQYVYINSRYISKGPIHKLLNQLATTVEHLYSWNTITGTHKGKRSRWKTFPAYILNLSCPRSLYDLTFEPSKTYVVFKDWDPVLAFIKMAIRTVWAENVTHGESFSLLGKDLKWKENDNAISAKQDLFDLKHLENAEFPVESARSQNDYVSLHPSSVLERHTKEDDSFSCEDCERIAFPELQEDNVEFEGQTSEMGIVCQTGFSFPSSYGSFADCLPIVPQKLHPGTSKEDIPPEDSHFLGRRFSAAENFDYWEVDFLSSRKEHFQIEPGPSKRQFETSSSFGRDNFGIEKDIKKPYLRSCLRGSLQHSGAWFAAEEGLESPVHSFKKKKRVSWDERIEVLHDISHQNLDLSPRDLRKDKLPCVQYPSRLLNKGNLPSSFNHLSKTSTQISYCVEPLIEERSFITGPTILLRKSGSGRQPLNSEWCSLSDPFLEPDTLDVRHYNSAALEGSFRQGEEIDCRHLEGCEKHCELSSDITLKGSDLDKCITSSTNSQLNFEDYNCTSNDPYNFIPEYDLPKYHSPENSNTLNDRTDLCPVPFGNTSAGMSKHERQSDFLIYQNFKKTPIAKKRSRRSHSAPPFHRQKMKFISLNHFTRIEAAEPNVFSVQNFSTSQEVSAPKHLQQDSCVCLTDSNPDSVEDLNFDSRLDIMRKSDTTWGRKSVKRVEHGRQSQLPETSYVAEVEDFISKETEDLDDHWSKWRDGPWQTTNSNRSHLIQNQDNILDISSGLLHLAGDSLVPESIDKKCLEDAKVLQQVDKKFIPIVAGGALAVIDQHAADERIRLEELRQKVLSGEARTVTFLESEQELALPEMGYQLLHNFSEQIKDWGWICNIHTQGSRSFKKTFNLLYQQPTVVRLLAVPCILGVNLSDVDLLKYLQQLADTDGSSTMPPAVLNVLNSKACRGAIMFGDSLLPSECSLIVEELKQTSLCFQCAHGRPTTVPLVDLEALHQQIARLGGLNCNSTELWHGLHRHEISIERASQRLKAAREQL